MKAPKWAVGMRMLVPGIYADASGAWHIDEHAVCEHYGVPYTTANAERIIAALLKAYPGTPVEEVEDPPDARTTNAHT